MENSINKKTRLVKANDLKFLSFIYPEQNLSIQMELKINIEGEWIKADARLLDNTIVLFKFKGIFIQK